MENDIISMTKKILLIDGESDSYNKENFRRQWI